MGGLISGLHVAQNLGALIQAHKGGVGAYLLGTRSWDSAPLKQSAGCSTQNLSLDCTVVKQPQPGSLVPATELMQGFVGITLQLAVKGLWPHERREIE